MTLALAAFSYLDSLAYSSTRTQQLQNGGRDILSVWKFGKGLPRMGAWAHLLEELTLPRPKGITEMWLQLSVLYLVCTPLPTKKVPAMWSGDVGPGGSLLSSGYLLWRSMSFKVSLL